MNPPKGARILVAMSGGVDSAAAAALLVEAGYDCAGVTLRLVPNHPGTSVFEPCCGIEAAQDARRVCERLGIPHHTMHAVERFDSDIVSYFLDEYARGRTPNPCVRCNRLIKFGALYERADELGAEFIAMGHYARIGERDGRATLRRAAHRPKDQTYVLAPLTQEQLRRALFPLGELTKAEAREIAGRIDVRSGEKPESQEICFVPDRNYAGYIEQRRGPMAPGPIVNRGGEVLGRHKGLIHYTIGQRRGLGIGASAPYYVIELDVAKNAVVVGHRDETCAGAFRAGPLSWGGIAPQEGAVDCEVQLHSRHKPAPATFTPSPEATHVRLHQPQPSVTPGQWAVFYGGDYVLASAIVEAAEATPGG